LAELVVGDLGGLPALEGEVDRVDTKVSLLLDADIVRASAPAAGSVVRSGDGIPILTAVR